MSGAACKGKESKKNDTSNVASGSALVTNVDAGSTAAPPETPDERCAAPCRFLAETPLAEIGDKVKAACKSEWPAVSGTDCEELDYQRNCIFASAGYTFKKQRYQDAFGKAPWYKARADFKDADLSKVATANIAELKKRAAECRTGGMIDDKDRKIVETWLDKLRAGKPEVPETLIDEGEPFSRDDFKKGLVSGKDQFAKKMLKGMRYVPQAELGEGWQKFQKPVRKFVVADFSDAGSEDCEDECGYGLWLTFAIDDKDKIIAVEEQGAACPAVYRDGVLQGEILRSLAYPVHEASQSLAVTAPCSGTVTYRIVEEKREVTHLDELVLVVDHEVIFPVSCGALCANDGRSATLAHGESLDVTFEIPAGLACGNAKLRANGHYVPVR